MDLTVYMADFNLFVLLIVALIATIMTLITAPSYSRQGLLDLRPARSKLPPDVYRTVCSLGICSRWPTRRGCRGGKTRVQSSISFQKEQSSLPSYTDSSIPPPNSQFPTNNLPIRAKLCVLNTRSVRNKATEFVDLVLDNKYDIVGITETWFKPKGDEVAIGNMTPAGYTFHHVPRMKKSGGGVGILYKSTLSV